MSIFTIYYGSEFVLKINQAVNADLEGLKGLLEGNKLSLNVAKTEAMIIGSNGNLRKLTLLIQLNRTVRLVLRISLWLRRSNIFVFRLTINVNRHLTRPWYWYTSLCQTAPSHPHCHHNVLEFNGDVC